MAIRRLADDFAASPKSEAQRAAKGVLVTGGGLVAALVDVPAGRDPAFGGGPLATVIQDVLSLLTYFLIATAILC